MDKAYPARGGFELRRKFILREYEAYIVGCAADQRFQKISQEDYNVLHIPLQEERSGGVGDNERERTVCSTS